jgi:L-alanine-DL-glutamate epimerase-like enolase superfamily enzyme
MAQSIAIERVDHIGELREEGGFKGLKLRLGRDRLADDLATIEAVREAVGSEMSLMVDFNQGLHLGEAPERDATQLMISASPGSRSPSSTTISRATRG